MIFYSPLRYPGGKGKIVPYFKSIIKKNSLLGSVYVEPYAGGASVGLSLLQEEYVSRIVINDIDRSIFAFWHSVLNNTNDLCELIRKTKVNVKTWREQIKTQETKEDSDLLDLGFSTFFLNRTNRSGILSAGVIGGLRQKGKWKINARYNKNDLIDRIRAISLYNNRIDLHNYDAVKLLRCINFKFPQNTLVYLDPPYYCKGKELYLNYYSKEDHEDISKQIKDLKRYWILTYDNVEPIQQLYKDYRQNIYDLRYSASISKVGQELMIFSNNLKISSHLLLN